jgi:hypothetical protein
MIHSLHPLDDGPGLVKLCQFPALDQHGNQLIEIFHHPDQLHHTYMDKVAAPFLPEVRTYLDELKPDANSIYALVNALGAFEYWGANINGDAFEEEYLIHRGPVWGYETFIHYARPYMHHANKGPNARAFGNVELSCWNPNMHRVELVVRLDRRMAEHAGAHKVIDKIDHGMLPDTSMGCKVAFDLCSITTDWDMLRKALRGFDPKRHRHPGIAALEYHKNIKNIPGLSITRDDYSDYAKYRMNEILPDGRKVCVYNPWPRFFDISFVFIGAEKQSKMMAKLASRAYIVVPSSYVAEQYGYESAVEDQPRTHKEFEKVAAPFDLVRDKLRELREKKASQNKRAEIIKEIVPSQFMGKAVPVLEQSEPDLPRSTLDSMSKCPMSESMSTPTMMGITLKPQEFQRIVICRIGKPDLADKLDDEGKVFGPVDDVDKSVSMGPEHINGGLASMLRDAIDDRGVFGPSLTRRMVRITVHGIPKPQPEREEVSDDLLDKVSAAYNGYREQVIEKIAEMSTHLTSYPEVRAAVFGQDTEDIFTGELSKEAAGIDPKLLLGAIPATYLVSALARRKTRKDLWLGKRPGMLTAFLGNHPHLAATAVGLAALKAGGSNLPDQLLKGALTIGKRVVHAG